MPEVRVDAPNDVPLSSGAMKSLPRRLRPLASLAALAAALLACVASPAPAQSLSIGAGGALVDDAGNDGKPSNLLSSREAHAFAELWIEPGSFVQLRYTRMELPGTVETAPEVRVDAAEATVSYLFREEWWEGGFFGGIGGYRLDPKTPGADEVSVDSRENAFGLAGGVLAIVRLGKRFEVRVEGTVRWLAADVKRTPVSIGASLAYRF